MMTFSEAVRTCLHKYVDFEGRATRAEYWWFYFFTFLIEMIACIPLFYGCSLVGITALLQNDPSAFTVDSLIWMSAGGILVSLVALALLLPSLSVTVRRLHDINKSGWWWFITLVPYIGSFILFIFMLLASGPDNQYGPDPYASQTVNE